MTGITDGRVKYHESADVIRNAGVNPGFPVEGAGAPTLTGGGVGGRGNCMKSRNFWSLDIDSRLKCPLYPPPKGSKPVTSMAPQKGLAPTEIKVNAVADPGVIRRKSPTPEVGRKPVIWKKTLAKVHEIYKNWAEMTGGVLAPPLDPPL